MALLTTGLLGLGAAALPEPPAAPPKTMRGLIFSKTAGFRHDSIPDGIKALEEIAETTKETTCPMVFEASEDSTIFSAEQLARFDVVIFLSTTGDILNDEQQKAFESWYRNGRGFVGIHAAADTEHTWPWFGLLIGAYFKTHPPVQKATVVVEDRKHQSTAMLPERWERIDEWYVYNENPRTKKIAPVHVLANLDESTYDTGGHPMGDHPIAWCHEFDGGRSWYTGGGHTKESFSEPLFREHIRQGIAWSVKRRIEPVKAPTAPAPELAPAPGPARTSTPADRK